LVSSVIHTSLTRVVATSIFTIYLTVNLTIATCVATGDTTAVTSAATGNASVVTSDATAATGVAAIIPGTTKLLVIGIVKWDSWVNSAGPGGVGVSVR